MTDFVEISSQENKIFKLVNSLSTSAKARKKNGAFLLEGLRICKDAFENNITFSKLIVSESAMEKHTEDILQFTEISERCYILSDELFKKIADTETPQGIMAIGNIPQSAVFPINLGKFVALENIQDPSNLGAVSRTAEALGVSGLILTNDCTDPFSPKSLRASMGTLLRLPLFFTDDILAFCKEKGIRTIATVVDKDATDIKNFTFKNGDAVIIGNEGNGLTEKLKQKSDERITVKMTGKAESLNAAAAAAITVWEMMK